MIPKLHQEFVSGEVNTIVNIHKVACYSLLNRKQYQSRPYSKDGAEEPVVLQKLWDSMSPLGTPVSLTNDQGK